MTASALAAGLFTGLTPDSTTPREGAATNHFMKTTTQPPTRPAMQGMSPAEQLAERYRDTRRSVRAVIMAIEGAEGDLPHEDDATEADLARLVNAHAKLRLALQEVER